MEGVNAASWATLWLQMEWRLGLRQVTRTLSRNGVRVLEADFLIASRYAKRSQLRMTYELACALQQAGRIRQRCAAEEPYVYVRSEDIEVAEGRISQTCN